MCFPHGLIQPAPRFNQPLDYPHNLALIQLRRGGNYLCIYAKRRHNARINRARIQHIKHSTLRMKAALFALRLNELLGCAAHIIYCPPIILLCFKFQLHLSAFIFSIKLYDFRAYNTMPFIFITLKYEWRICG